MFHPNTINLKDIFELLKENIVKKNIGDVTCLNDVSINLQTSTLNQIVFYKLKEGEGARTLLESRLKSAKFGLLILNRDPKLSCQNIIVVKENFFFHAQGLLLNSLFPLSTIPKLIGVTGTNGKTTTVYLARQMAQQFGYQAISIGTLGVQSNIGKEESNFTTTTPSFIELYKTIYKFQKVDAVFMEVSSHALVQNRIGCFKFNLGAWTSFSSEHLDFHNSMNEYFQAKTLLFKKHFKKDAKLVLPQNESFFQDCFSKKILAPIIEDAALPFALSIKYNLLNLSIAKCLCDLIWGKKEIDYSKLKLPKGRFESFQYFKKRSQIIVDYAHTPDAIFNLLTSIKEIAHNKNIVIVFGCGGDRDKIKRPLMGDIASKLADLVIITSDNPRTEDPMKIINEILSGIDLEYKSKATYILDRKQAINQTMQSLTFNSILVLAGKGHENYQDIAGNKKYFSDQEIIIQNLGQVDNG